MTEPEKVPEKLPELKRDTRTIHQVARDMEHFNRYFDKDNPR